ncbi:metastasis-associated protein MTA1-like [Notolabrus celidotus]|uniref:metastasis-associated protein MTA1-like n=1 Tax=Notolabrus celidotus TaxID=1203425 RepID=UPI00148FE13E|nr:metastasis-associated protein MTA1-like [Notolabrus celidotus]
MLRVSEGQGTRLPKTRAAQRSTLTSVLHSSVVSLPESRPAAHAPRSHRTPGLQTPPPRRLLSSLPHGPHGMLGKRSYHHHSRVEQDRRSENPSTTGGPLLHNGRNSGSGSTRGGVMIRKRRPNWIDAPDDSFFLVTRETRTLSK